MSEIKKRANHVRTNLKTMELAIEEQEKVDKTRYERQVAFVFYFLRSEKIHIPNFSLKSSLIDIYKDSFRPEGAFFGTEEV